MAKKKQNRALATLVTSGWSLVVLLFYLTVMGPFVNALFRADESSSNTPEIVTQVTCQPDSMTITVPAQANAYTAVYRGVQSDIDEQQIEAHADARSIRFERPADSTRTEVFFIDITTGTEATTYRGICATLAFGRTFWLLGFAALVLAWGPSLFLSERLGARMFIGPTIFATLAVAAQSRLLLSGSSLLLVMAGYIAIIIVVFAAVEWQRRR